MRILLLFFIFFFMGTWGCDDRSVKHHTVKLVPDNTPLIVGILEASPDTTHHHTQVFVATVSNLLDPTAPTALPWQTTEFEKTHGTPLFYAQVVGWLGLFALKSTFQPTAKVMIKGPLNQPNEKTVTLTYEAGGIFGDINRQIPLMPNQSYQLTVEFSDERKYSSEMTIPGYITLEIPARLEIPVKVTRLTDSWFEENVVIDEPRTYFTRPQNSEMAIVQRNTDTDREVDRLLPNEEYRWAEKGNFLRQGTNYYISTNRTVPRQYFTNGWVDLSIFPFKTQIKTWYRFSALDPHLSRTYWHEFTVSEEPPNDPFTDRAIALDQAIRRRDTTIAFTRSNILKLDTKNNPLPKEKSDAIGTFGGYSSRYIKSAMIPIRNYDICSYNWKGCPNNP